jgi:hypothetical protein
MVLPAKGTHTGFGSTRIEKISFARDSHVQEALYDAVQWNNGQRHERNDGRSEMTDYYM